MNRLLLKRFLNTMNVELREAENGISALTIWEAWQPDLIFMDLMMPEMDGCTAIGKIRQMTHGNTVVIVAYTASTNQTPQSTLPDGCDDILYKPFKLHELNAVLERQLNLNISF